VKGNPEGHPNVHFEGNVELYRWNCTLKFLATEKSGDSKNIMGS